MIRRLTIITQNIDELHGKSGAEDVIELHGNLFKTRKEKSKINKVRVADPVFIDPFINPFVHPSIHLYSAAISSERH